MRPYISKENDFYLLEVYPLGDLGVNTSFITKKKNHETLIIDAGNDLENLKRIIKKQNLKVTELYHTHAHFDHIGHSSDIQKAHKSKMALHKDDFLLYSKLQEQARYFMQAVSEDPSQIDHYLAHAEKIGFEEKILEVIHTPGHSQGGTCFFTTVFDTPVLFSGDTLFRRSIGRTDLPGGDYEKLLSSIKTKLFILPDETLVIPGHGEETTIGEEKKQNPFLV